MIEIKGKGRFETVPPIVESIVSSDIPAISEYFSKHDLNEKIELGEYTALSPLAISLSMNLISSIKWFVINGADLNAKDNPSFLIAVRYCNEEIIRYLVESGAKTDLVNNVKSDAFAEALYGKKFKNLPLIEELGHTVSKYGGMAFRLAVSNRNYTAIEFFINHGVDINYNEPDQVYPYTPTPLCIAARYVDLNMVKYLVDHGADVTLAEKDGMRPYNIAIEKGDMEMAVYLKGFEPQGFHNLQNKLDKLRSYKLPNSLISFLQSDNLNIDLGENNSIKYIEFFQFIDTVEMKVGRQKLLRISKEVDNYSDIIICWNPKVKKIAFYDIEHQELANVCSFEELIKEPADRIENYLNCGHSE